MCLALYVSSSLPVLPINFINGKVGFYIRELETFENYVFQNFSKKLAYYIGSAEGCSCAFLMDGVYPDMEEFLEVRETYYLLSNFLHEKVESNELEIYFCWIGQEKAKPTKYHQISTGDITKTDFAFEEGHFYTVNNF